MINLGTTLHLVLPGGRIVVVHNAVSIPSQGHIIRLGSGPGSEVVIVEHVEHEINKEWTVETGTRYLAGRLLVHCVRHSGE